MKLIQLEREDGQSLVLIAMAMVGIIAMVGLVIDGSRDFVARRQSQNASDAAAFAGARALTTRTGNGPSDDARILSTINTYALANQIASATNVSAYYMLGSTQGAQVGGNTVPSGATGIRVFTTISFQPFLMTILFGAVPVVTTTKATAQTGPLTETDKIMPVTMCKWTVDADEDEQCSPGDSGELQYGEDYQLFGENQGPGNFQWLDFTNLDAGECQSPNDVELANDLNPYTPQSIDPIAVGDWICGAPGKKVGTPVRDSLDEWLNNFDADNRLWIIPLFDDVHEQGQNFQYRVAQFAVFQLSEYDFQGNPKSITGTFLRYTTLEHTGESGQPCNNIGGAAVGPICAVNLTE